MLAKEIEDKAFALNAGQHTQPIRTKQGFIILQATQHNLGGDASFKQVEPQVEEALFMERMQPALRVYLTKLREEASIDLKPGVVDTGASGNEMRLTYSAYTPPAAKEEEEICPHSLPRQAAHRSELAGSSRRRSTGGRCSNPRGDDQRPPAPQRHLAPRRLPASRRPRNRRATTTRTCRSRARKRRSALGRPRASLFLSSQVATANVPSVRTRIRVSPLLKRAT